MTKIINMRLACGLWLVGIVFLLPGCASTVRPFGTLATLPVTDIDGRTFAMANSETPAANGAVRDALLSTGYRLSTDAHYRVEVGFAMRTPRIDVMTKGGGSTAMQSLTPKSRPPSLCRGLSYVLSIAFVERASGRVTARGGAITSRCGKALDANLLPLLARAALSNNTGSITTS